MRTARTIRLLLGATAMVTTWRAVAADGTNSTTLSASLIRNAPDIHSRRAAVIAENRASEQSTEDFANVAQTIHRWSVLPPAQRRDSRVLAEVRVDELGSDYEVKEHVQRIIGIGTSSDIANYSIPIEYSREKHKLVVLSARLHRADGRSVQAQDLGEKPSADPMSDGSLVRTYQYRNLQGGDVLELEYVLAPIETRNPYGPYFAELVAFGGALPCDLQRYVLRVPKGISIAASESLIPSPGLQDTVAEKVYRWEKTDFAALVREPRSPSWSEQGAFVHVSNFATWQDLGKWYAELVNPQLQLDTELQTLADQFSAQHSNRLDRLAAIYDFVLKKTRYSAQEKGIYGFKPYPVTETFARGYGDCKDKAALMIALLRATGIEAQIALVRTRELGQIVATPASASIFDHAVVYVPEFDVWLDATAEFARLRELPVEDQGAMALTIDADGNAALRQIPLSTADDNYSRRTISARLDTDGTIHFSGATYVRGEDAPEVRRQLQPGESQVGYVRERLAQVFPAVEVRHVEMPQSLEELVALNFDGEVHSYRGKHTVALPTSWMQRNYIETLTPETARTQDLRLDVPWTTEEEIHIQLPEGARLESLPQDQTIEIAFARADLNFKKDGDEIVVLTKVQFRETSIAVADYAAFREFNVKLEKAFAGRVEIDLP